MREPVDFYRYAGHVGRVVLVTDRIPVQRKREAVEKALKQYLRQRFPAPHPFRIEHGPSEGYGGLQAADYCTWAVHKIRLHQDERPYAEIAPFVRRAVCVDADGKTLKGTPRLGGGG